LSQYLLEYAQQEGILGTETIWKEERMSDSGESASLFDGIVQDLESTQTRSVADWELVDEPLGSGAYGVTYLATKTKKIGQKSIAIRGAIKLVNLDRSTSSSQINSLVGELTKLSKFHSRYIANLIDAGTFAAAPNYTLPYFVMDYIEGDNLQTIVDRMAKNKQPRMQPAMFRNLALNTLRALLTAHDAKILHLDIKPANIMHSSKDETFVLIDFGISTFVENDIVDGFFGGTPGYIAPEVFLQKASHASDVYSLGLTFYEALTLKKPFIEQYRLALQDNPKLDSSDTKVIQSLSKKMMIDLSLLGDDQRALIEPMLDTDPMKRPSLDKLIDIAERLVIPDNSSPQISQTGLAPQIYESWEQMGVHITQLISSQGIQNADIVVDDTAHLKLWFRTKVAGDQIAILCPSPKNTVALGQLGWKSQADSTHAKEVASSVEEVSDAIVKAMKIGFSLKPPVSVTKRHGT
jgi:serine/threonine protein kinase